MRKIIFSITALSIAVLMSTSAFAQGIQAPDLSGDEWAVAEVNEQGFRLMVSGGSNWSLNLVVNTVIVSRVNNNDEVWVDLVFWPNQDTNLQSHVLFMVFGYQGSEDFRYALMVDGTYYVAKDPGQQMNMSPILTEEGNVFGVMLELETDDGLKTRAVELN